MSEPLSVAVLGLGEAGAAIARDLAEAGARVAGFDPREGAGDGLPRADSPEAAVDGAEIVLSVNSADAAAAAARSVLGSLTAGQVFADLNSAGAPLKRELAHLVEPSGALFADVALMAGVPGRGLRTPALVSGSGARLFAERMGAAGMPVEVVGEEPGQAAVRKLLRSVFMKGLAAAAIEALSAAGAAGCEDWLREEIAGALTSADAALLERLETGSRRHAARRVHEVEDASALLRELGVEPRISEASAGWLMQLRDEGKDGMTEFPASHQDLLDAEVATLATVGADGYPQLSEVWFLHDGGELKISLNDSRLKTKNLTARPECNLLILDLKNPYRYLAVKGNARLEPDSDYSFAQKVGAKYGGADLREHDGPADSRVIVTIEPVNVWPVDMRGG